GVGSAVVHGGSGNDAITAGSGATVYGEDGNDTLTSTAGGNSLYGGADDDRINGRSDDVALDGGSGNDVLALPGAPAVTASLPPTGGGTPAVNPTAFLPFVAFETLTVPLGTGTNVLRLDNPMALTLTATAGTNAITVAHLANAATLKLNGGTN